LPIFLILDGRTNKKLKTALDRGGHRHHTLAGWPRFLSFRLSEWRRLFQGSGFRYWLREPATECAPGLISNRSQIILPLICRLGSSPTTAWAGFESGRVCLLRAAGIGSSRLEHSRLRSRRASFRQATEPSNRKRRIATSILKNYEAKARLSVGRDKSQHLSGQPGKVNSSGAGPEKTQVNRLTFAEDFSQEHCRSSRRIAVIGIWGGAETAPKEPQPSTQSFGFPC
jgi:hypothetical protein